jgi:hypothetical protein
VRGSEKREFVSLAFGLIGDEDLMAAPVRRSVDAGEIDRAFTLVSGPDPAGVLRKVTRDDVVAVATYLQVRVGRTWVPTPDWALIERGHPAARAIFVHEWAELEAYRRLGIRQPLRVKRPGETYRRAHAWASWEEAQYWARWTEAAGEPVPAAAFLRAHPLRGQSPDQIAAEIRDLKRFWKVSVPNISRVESERARIFYEYHEMTPEGRQKWLRRSDSVR